MFEYENLNVDEISARIRKLKEDKGISDKEIAETLMVSSQAVSKWMYGKSLPDIEHLYNLAGLFGVSVDYLISGLKIRNNQQMLPFKEEIYRDMPRAFEIKNGDYYIEMLAKNAQEAVDSNALRLMHYALAVERIRRQKYRN